MKPIKTLKKVFGYYYLPMYIIVRPFSGFYAMKYENKGSLLLALFNFLALSISISFANQYASVLVNPRHPNSVNSLFDFSMLSIALLLFCVSNWAVTSLTDGKGRFKDIIMTVCYAMTPMVLTIIPAAVFSNILTLEEGAFYFIILNVSVFWFIVLVFAGLVTVHSYTAKKAVATVFLTFIALLVIVFLITLLLTLLQQLAIFISSVYTEIMFRV